MADSKLAVALERNANPLRQKTAKHVAACIVKYAVPGLSTPERVRIACYKLLVSELNRAGQPLNLPYMHDVIIKSLLEVGLDPSKPPVGVACLLSTAGKDKTVKHNLETYGGIALYPPVQEQHVQFSTLCCSHLNTAFRCFRAQLATSKGRRCVAPGPGP